MRCFALVLAGTALTCGCERVEDTAELFQASARLSEDGAPEALRKMKEAMEKMTEKVKDEVTQLTREAVQDELRRNAAARASAAEATIAAQKATEQFTESTVEVEQAAHVASKYGDDMTLTLRLPNGRELVSGFHSNARLQAFMHSMCRKLDLPFNMVTFWAGGKQVDPRMTAAEVGIADHGVLTISGAVVDALVSEEKLAAEKAAEEERERREAAEAHDRVVADRVAKQKRVDQKNAEVAAEHQRKQELRDQGRTTLAFVPSTAGVLGEPVLIAVKYDNWLHGTFELVCKRLGITECAKARFLKMESKAEIKPQDSVKSLMLKDNEKILVHVPVIKS